MSQKRKNKKKRYELRKARRMSKFHESIKDRKRRLRHWKESPYYKTLYSQSPQNNNQEFQIVAPEDFRFLSNTEVCSRFFRRLRTTRDAILQDGYWKIKIDLSRIKHIDFASTMMLDAIGDELLYKQRPCHISGNMPDRRTCRKYLEDSGFLNEKYDNDGNMFQRSPNSTFMRIERGQNKLTTKHIRTLVNIEQTIYKHLFGELGRDIEHIELMKEICGNSVEWSNSFKSQWTIGAKLEQDKAIIVALDLGEGILNSLHIKFKLQLSDLLKKITDKEVLAGAFDQKYGSSSKLINRNQGLPSIKQAFLNGKIKDLKVITNNVRINFSDYSNSTRFATNRSAFCGTLYSWVIDINCFNN